MASSAATSTWRTLLDEKLPHLLDEAARAIEAETDARVRAAEERVRSAARREIADTLNQSARRLAQAESFEQCAATLADAASSFCGVAAVLRVSGAVARPAAIRGASPEGFETSEIPLAQARALAGAIESNDPVVTAANERELSLSLMEIVSPAEGARVWIFPIAVRNRTQALLVTSGDVESSPIELMTAFAGAALAAREPVALPPAPAPLVTIGVPGSKPAARPSWDDLSREERAVHLRAQRFARVRVSELRLHHRGALDSGIAARDVYHALQPQIDAMREEFRKEFMVEAAPSMVDYIHVELSRSLANEDASLLGPNYPGPLV